MTTANDLQATTTMTPAELLDALLAAHAAGDREAHAALRMFSGALWPASAVPPAEPVTVAGHC